MFVCCECRVLSGRGLCDELITRPEESYRLRCVAVCDLETSRMRRPWPALGRSATKKGKKSCKNKEFDIMNARCNHEDYYCQCYKLCGITKNTLVERNVTAFVHCCLKKRRE